jgi:small GTP-binding protein
MVPNHARSLLRKGYFYFRREFQRSKWTSAVSRSLSSSSSSSSRSDALLASHNQEIVIAEKQMLANLHELLRVSDASKEELDLVVDTRTRIEDFFTVVVCGEFNSGKSTLINAMFGEKHLKEGLLPTTNKIHIVRTKQQKLQGGAYEAGKIETTMNLNIDDVTTLEIALQDRMQWLKDIAIIDTPGTNAIVKKHEELTQKIIPRADMILFVTSAERPLTESESTFLSQIQKWGKNVIMVVNKVDLLEDQQSMTTVMDYVKQNAGNILNLSATDLLPVFGVSGKSALDARLFAGPGEDLTNDTDLRDMDGTAKQKSTAKRYWRRSNLEPFENFLKDTLMQEKLIEAKLDTVLVVADRVLLNLKAKIDKRQALLDSDFRVLALLEENLAMFEEDFDQTGDDYKHRLNDILTR